MPWPLSIVTDEISQDLDECGVFLARHALDSIEVRCVAGARVPDLTDADRGRIAWWVRDEGIEVVCVSPGTFKGDVADKSRLERERDDVLPRAIELAVEWNAPFVVTFGFENPSGAAAPPHAIDALRAAADRCADAGRTLLIENEPGFLAGTAAETRALVDAVAHPDCAVNWDPCNGNEYEPAQLGAAVEALGATVRHVHVKNGRLTAGQRFPRYGSLADGDIDWLGHLRQLRAAGYSGHLGIETHFEPLIEGSATLVSELRAMLSILESDSES
jgi:sugar phosphate isomerase/epimerase